MTSDKVKPNDGTQKGGYSAPVIHDKPVVTPKAPPPKPNPNNGKR